MAEMIYRFKNALCETPWNFANDKPSTSQYFAHGFNVLLFYINLVKWFYLMEMEYATPNHNS